MHIVSDFCVYPTCLYTFPNVFPPFFCATQDAGGASNPAPNTDEVMEDDSDEELTGPVVGNLLRIFFRFFRIGSHPLSFGKVRRDTLTISQTFSGSYFEMTCIYVYIYICHIEYTII